MSEQASGQADNQGQEPDEHRNAARDSLFLTAEVSHADTGRIAKVRVRNLSEGGMMAEGPIPCGINMPVSILLRNVGAVTGRIAWAKGDRYGIAFDEPVDPKMVRAPAAVPAGIAETEVPRHVRPIVTDPRAMRRLGGDKQPF